MMNGKTCILLHGQAAMFEAAGIKLNVGPEQLVSPGTSTSKSGLLGGLCAFQSHLVDMCASLTEGGDELQHWS